MAGSNVLLVDQEDRERDVMARELRQIGFEVTAVASLNELRGPPAAPNAVVLCVSSSDSALEQVRAAREQLEGTSIVLIGHVPAVYAFEAGRAGVDVLLLRPVTASMIAAALMRQGSFKPPLCGSEWPSLARAEWEYLHAVLADCKGNRSETARRLRIHRSVLQRKLARNPPLR
jgi:two-component system, response regulator RegA